MNENSTDSFWHTINSFTKKRNTPILAIIQFGKAPEFNHLCSGTWRAIMDARHDGLFPEGEAIDILIDSPGGQAEVAYKVIRLLRKRYQRVNAVVPRYAKSAATLLCLGADTILMGEVAELGPLDVQITDPLERGSRPISPLDDFKSMEFLREYAIELLDSLTFCVLDRSGMSIKEALHASIPWTAQMIRPLYEKIDPLDVGGHRRSLAIGEEYAKRLLEMAKNPSTTRIVERLVWNYPSHDFVLDIEECKSLGLPVQLLSREDDLLLGDAIRQLRRQGLPTVGFGRNTTNEKPKPQAESVRKHPKSVPTSGSPSKTNIA